MGGRDGRNGQPFTIALCYVAYHQQGRGKPCPYMGYRLLAIYRQGVTLV